jgi:putative ABC transport system substrate-binding protein
MNRRDLITLLGGAAAAWPLAARAQRGGRTYRLGILHNQGPQSPQFPPFYDELRRLGFIEGQNLIVDSRGYAVRTEQFPAVAAELVKAQVDAILAGGAAAARAAQAATRTIPILTLTDDMVGQGLVASMARPGGNTTGISILATELDSKPQEILMEMVPAAWRELRYIPTTWPPHWSDELHWTSCKSCYLKASPKRAALVTIISVKPIEALSALPQGEEREKQLAAFLIDLGCSSDGAPYVARGLIRNLLLQSTGSQIAAVVDRFYKGKSNPTACLGVNGFTDKDWADLSKLSPDSRPDRDEKGEEKWR